MIITHDTNEATLSNVGSVGEFKIRNSARAFSILSSGLYSNKIKAIIRELSCNALDSHVGAGKGSVPFEVHLPTMLEPWFSVRDFGMGLDGNQVVDIYTTYFESTKSDSNDFVGALGLGSKSPFSYTENFTVTAIKHGTQRIYSAFINEQGVPSIAEMSEELTPDANGVEVKFSVTNRNDYSSFQNEARSVFKWFDIKPTITGNVIECSSPTYTERNIIPGVHLNSSDSYGIYNTGSVAVMGSIAYPMTDLPDAGKHFGNLAKLLDCGLTMTFAIGELDFAASREHLSYIPMTIDSIRSKLEELNASLGVQIATKVDAITCDWGKAAYLRRYARISLYRPAVIDYVITTKFPLYNVARNDGSTEFTHDFSTLSARGLSISGFRYSPNIRKSCKTIIPDTRDNGVMNGRVKVWTTPVDPDVVIILNDLKVGCMARAQYHYNTCGSKVPTTVMCVSHTSPDLAVRQLEYDKLLKELHNPPTVIYASSLIARERAKSTPSTGIASIRVKHDMSEGNEDAYTWEPCGVEFPATETYYYVALEGFTPVKDGKYINFFKDRALMDACGIAKIKDIEIYGVRKSRLKEISSLPNWVHYEEKLAKEILKISDSHIESLIAADVFDGYRNKVYTNPIVADRVGVDSAYNKFVKYSAGIKRTTGNVAQLVELCHKFGNAINMANTRAKLQKEITAVNKTYPLLRFFKDEVSVCGDVVDYVKLVDKNLKP